MIFDQYSFQARLMPVIISLSPILFAFFAWFPELYAHASSNDITLGSFVALGIMMILVNKCRENGIKAQQRLIKIWGGLPTTIYLRHRDTTIPQATKRRYFGNLKLAIREINIPDEDDESQNPIKSDEVYCSLVDWLIAYNRKSESEGKTINPLILKENINYGFRRNLFGNRHWAVASSALAFITNIIVMYYLFVPNYEVIPNIVIGATVYAVFFSILFLSIVNSDWVRSAADSYAFTLLSICEHIVTSE